MLKAKQSEALSDHFYRTRFALFAISILSVPLLAISNFIPVILYKYFQASQFQVTLLTMQKPWVAILALYWSYSVANRQDLLLPNVLWSGILARIPFLFVPFVESPWWIIVFTAFYWLLARGGIPAWMEILKQNLPKAYRSELFARGSALAYIEGGVLALGFAFFMDGYPHIWKWIFPISAVLGIFGVLTQSRISLKLEKPINFSEKSPKPSRPLISWKKKLIEPWRQSFALMKERQDFRLFQWGYMISACGMMIMHPALPIYFVDYLNASYKELAFGITICKGCGYAMTSYSWGKGINKVNIFYFSSVIFFLVALYPFFLLFGPVHIIWFYIGCLIYGIAQAGSELCWHMSGPIFSKNKESILYSSVNVTMIGVRGTFAPPIGGLLCYFGGPYVVFVVASILCFSSGILMYRWSSVSEELSLSRV